MDLKPGYLNEMIGKVVVQLWLFSWKLERLLEIWAHGDRGQVTIKRKVTRKNPGKPCWLGCGFLIWQAPLFMKLWIFASLAFQIKRWPAWRGIFILTWGFSKEQKSSSWKEFLGFLADDKFCNHSGKNWERTSVIYESGKKSCKKSKYFWEPSVPPQPGQDLYPKSHFSKKSQRE